MISSLPLPGERPGTLAPCDKPLDVCLLPGTSAMGESLSTGLDEGPNTESTLTRLGSDIDELKSNIRSNARRQYQLLQGIELEVVSGAPDNVNSFATKSLGYFPPAGGLNADPETWPRALEINTKVPSQIADMEEWYLQVARVLREAIASGHAVSLASDLSTVAPEDLVLDNLTRKPRTRALASSMPGELDKHRFNLRIEIDDVDMSICPEELILNGGARTLKLQGTDGGQLSFVSKATLGSLQIHLSGDPRDDRSATEVSHAAGHNSAALAQLFGMALGASSPCFAGYYSPLADLRLPLYQATVGPRRAPLGSQWFDDGNILQIFDEVLHSRDPLLIDPNDTGKRTSGSNLALNAMKTVWPPMVRPTVTFDRHGNADVHPELRALGTPQTLHDAVGISLFVAGLWKQLPSYLKENFGVEISDPDGMERVLPYRSFVESVWSTSLHGLSSKIHWFDGRLHSARQLILEEMIPLAHAGLTSLGVPPHARELYLAGLKKNVERGIDSSALERIFDLPGHDPAVTRTKLDLMHQLVAARSVDSFVDSRYSNPYFLSDAYDDMVEVFGLVATGGLGDSI